MLVLLRTTTAQKTHLQMVATSNSRPPVELRPAWSARPADGIIFFAIWLTLVLQLDWQYPGRETLRRGADGVAGGISDVHVPDRIHAGLQFEGREYLDPLTTLEAPVAAWQLPQPQWSLADSTKLRGAVRSMCSAAANSDFEWGA
mmetsp:Transcript_64350/g.140085  ORF Transcript_64350/g.140085 Transcript_64350/m.140085 type:complete len:145 (-) Transcript_64350:1816-2250(-)